MVSLVENETFVEIVPLPSRLLREVFHDLRSGLERLGFVLLRFCMPTCNLFWFEFLMRPGLVMMVRVM